MQTQYSMLGYRINLYFHDSYIAIKIDKNGHSNRNIDYEIKTLTTTKEKFGCKFIISDPDKRDFDIFNAINKTFRQIKTMPKNPNRYNIIGQFYNSLSRLEFK